MKSAFRVPAIPTLALVGLLQLGAGAQRTQLPGATSSSGIGSYPPPPSTLIDCNQLNVSCTTGSLTSKCYQVTCTGETDQQNHTVNIPKFNTGLGTLRAIRFTFTANLPDRKYRLVNMNPGAALDLGAQTCATYSASLDASIAIQLPHNAYAPFLTAADFNFDKAKLSLLPLTLAANNTDQGLLKDFACNSGENLTASYTAFNNGANGCHTTPKTYPCPAPQDGLDDSPETVWGVPSGANRVGIAYCFPDSCDITKCKAMTAATDGQAALDFYSCACASCDAIACSDTNTCSTPNIPGGCPTAAIRFQAVPDYAQNGSIPTGQSDIDNYIPYRLTVMVEYLYCATTPCVEVNRNDCGSLLLYPEFYRAAGEETLLTITDACCENPIGNTKVEFVFINKSNCQEFNRTYTLTPCDTLSLLMSGMGVPNNWRGYVYAFAKSSSTNSANPGGIPIVFNHLIGQEMRMSASRIFDFALNPVSFRGHGVTGVDGELNDNDVDGIRDLNALDPSVGAALWEYDPAPDKVIIPRFLGWDTAFTSDLILIALSGGSEFMTTARITGFDDSSHAFGPIDHPFYCWDRIPLSALGGGASFSSASLNGTSTVSEILDCDLTTEWHESGWFTVDGLRAESAGEIIEAPTSGPALYAVLVETAGAPALRGSDLPFEYCAQFNGDLLPHGLLGDGPTPVNNDDQ